MPATRSFLANQQQSYENSTSSSSTGESEIGGGVSGVVSQFYLSMTGPNGTAHPPAASLDSGDESPMDEHETITTYIETTVPVSWIISHWKYFTEEEKEHFRRQNVLPELAARLWRRP